jgi:hypothetical protein
VADLIDDLKGVRPEERARLERFALAFERVNASSYPLFTEVNLSPEVEAAQGRALEVIGTGSRRNAIRAAVDAFVDHATTAYSNRTTLTDTFLMNQSLPDRAEDRVRFLATVERAVVALILWDELDEDDQAALVGPWGAFVDEGNNGSS